MEATRIHLPSRRNARIEINPLIDVIFFLLATFVLFSLSLNRIQSLPLELPGSGPLRPASPDLVTIQVSGQGILYWNGERFDLAELPGRLARFKETAEAPRVLVTGDNHARWAMSVEVLDRIRRSGIKVLSMETRTRPTGR